MNTRVLLVALLGFLAGCGPSQQELDLALNRAEKLEVQVQALQVELEELKFGAPRLLGQAKAASEAGDDDEAKRLITELLDRHAGAPESKEATELNAQIDARIAAEAALLKKEQDRKSEEQRVLLARATRNMEKTKDEINAITWITHRNAPMRGKYVSLYFGTRSGSAENSPLRMRAQYFGSNWLFVKSITVAADEHVYELEPMDFKRDHAAGDVWEWVDMPVRNHLMLERMMSAKKLVIRFIGDQYVHDFTVPDRHKAQIREVNAAWKAMGGHP